MANCFISYLLYITFCEFIHRYTYMWTFLFVDNVVFTSIHVLDVVFLYDWKKFVKFEDFIKTELYDNVKCTSTHVTPLKQTISKCLEVCSLYMYYHFIHIFYNFMLFYGM